MPVRGLVTKALANFFTVMEGGAVRQCRARGVLKKKGITILVGDVVEVEPVGATEGVIVEVLPRKTELVRPPVANVDQAVLVASMAVPDFHPRLLDRMLVTVQAAGLRPLIVLTKTDLVTAEAVAQAMAPYAQAGYTVLPVCAQTGDGVDAVRAQLENRISVFAGASGVGKSTLANAVLPGLGLKMGEVSRLGRGRHTTRHVELFPFGSSGFIADAPGFSQLDLLVQSDELRRYFPDFEVVARHCEYRGCLHDEEQHCGVKEAVREGRLSRSRYDSYLAFLRELQEKEANLY
ncbi:MAG: ribosome small subunit-dependent GTPase A [Alicyclobacillaceae bacterium]|nr:ribosome small subunit-dependent GTPase A [Alicyclobacillaceae bacterium]